MSKLILVLSFVSVLTGCASPYMGMNSTSNAWDTSAGDGHEVSYTGRAVYGGPGN